MNYKRKFNRKNLIKIPRCCGTKMTYKECYGIYVCEICGKERRIPMNNWEDEIDMLLETGQMGMDDLLDCILGE